MGENNQIPDHVNLIKDGDTMRMLGAWVGNGINIEEKWKTIIMKQQKIMNIWKKSRPTFRGKELILKALTTSKSWFLATVNGMPKHIQREMEKNMKDFLWDGRKKRANNNGGSECPERKWRTGHT